MSLHSCSLKGQEGRGGGRGTVRSREPTWISVQGTWASGQVLISSSVKWGGGYLAQMGSVSNIHPLSLVHQGTGEHDSAGSTCCCPISALRQRVPRPQCHPAWPSFSTEAAYLVHPWGIRGTPQLLLISAHRVWCGWENSVDRSYRGVLSSCPCTQSPSQ